MDPCRRKKITHRPVFCVCATGKKEKPSFPSLLIRHSIHRHFLDGRRRQRPPQLERGRRLIYLSGLLSLPQWHPDNSPLELLLHFHRSGQAWSSRYAGEGGGEPKVHSANPTGK